ncbi:hypothetical protein GUJ93_ZPchr0002g26273 [Zizania palustris]|uniref:Uncharacterized protein n=1 Tax=Zizania palustris TaxID=103762 RepID=A0A8J5REG0_ZIZPA|nr:hypothetical protein GUJ93_ZPchr0002g26273 [Zizania palustris]
MPPRRGHGHQPRLPACLSRSRPSSRARCRGKRGNHPVRGPRRPAAPCRAALASRQTLSAAAVRPPTRCTPHRRQPPPRTLRGLRVPTRRAARVSGDPVSAGVTLPAAFSYHPPTSAAAPGPPPPPR